MSPGILAVNTTSFVLTQQGLLLQHAVTYNYNHTPSHPHSHRHRHFWL